MNIQDHIVDDKLRIIVKPNAPETKVLGYDENKKAVRVSVSAVADKDKANKALVRFISKLVKRKVVIVSGSRSREKVLGLL